MMKGKESHPSLNAFANEMQAARLFPPFNFTEETELTKIIGKTNVLQMNAPVSNGLTNPTMQGEGQVGLLKIPQNNNDVLQTQTTRPSLATQQRRQIVNVIDEAIASVNEIHEKYVNSVNAPTSAEKLREVKNISMEIGEMIIKQQKELEEIYSMYQNLESRQYELTKNFENITSNRQANEGLRVSSLDNDRLPPYSHSITDQKEFNKYKIKYMKKHICLVMIQHH